MCYIHGVEKRGTAYASGISTSPESICSKQQVLRTEKYKCAFESISFRCFVVDLLPHKHCNIHVSTFAGTEQMRKNFGMWTDSVKWWQPLWNPGHCLACHKCRNFYLLMNYRHTLVVLETEKLYHRIGTIQALILRHMEHTSLLSSENLYPGLLPILLDYVGNYRDPVEVSTWCWSEKSVFIRHTNMLWSFRCHHIWHSMLRYSIQSEWEPKHFLLAPQQARFDTPGRWMHAHGSFGQGRIC